MDETQAILTERLQANGGKMLYSDLIDGLEYQQRMHVPSVLRRMRDTNVAKREVKRNAETGQMEFTVQLIGG